MRFTPPILVAATALIGLIGIAAACLRATTPDASDRSSTRHPIDPSPSDLKSLLRAADVARGVQLFGECSACHSIGRGGPDLDGPNLYGVVGSRAAERRPRFGYTAALRAGAAVWSFDRLDAWLTNPKALVPGTSMPFAGLPDPQDRADLIAYLNQQGSHLALP